MKKNWLLTTLLATVTIAMGTTTTAFASPPTDITPEHPGGVTAPHSPDGIPSNIEGPSTPSWTSAIRFAMKNPGAKVPGTNDFACKPRKGTHPVVLIPGTSEDAFITWSYYGPTSRQQDSAPTRSTTTRKHIRLWKPLRPAATSTPRQPSWPTSLTGCSRQPVLRRSISSAIRRVAVPCRARTSNITEAPRRSIISSV